MADAEAKRKEQMDLEVMMFDLGLGRMEELAKDDSRDGRRLRFPMQSTHAPSGPPEQHQAQAPRVVMNEAAKGWNAAVSSGAFHDDDARGVRGLDTIANGRLHALNKAKQEVGDTGRRGDHPGNSADLGRHTGFRQRTSWEEMKHRKMNSGSDSRYDPTNPSKPKFISRPYQQISQPVEDRPHATPQVELPQSNEMSKQWQSFKPVKKKQTQEPPVTVHRGGAHIQISPEIRGGVTNGPRKSAPHVPQQLVEQEASVASNVDCSGEKSFEQTPGRILVSSMALSPVTFVNPESKPQSQLRPSSPSINGRLTVLPNQHAVSPALNSLTHLSLLAQPEVPDSTRQATTAVSPAQIRLVTLEKDGSKPRIFYEAGMWAARVIDNDVTVTPGKMYLYQYPGKQVAIWELRWSNGYVTREDIRNFVMPLIQRCRVTVRRQDRPDQQLRTSQVRLETPLLANQFVQVCKELKTRFKASVESRYSYTDELNRPSEGDVVDLSTLKAIRNSPDAATPASAGLSATTSDDKTKLNITIHAGGEVDKGTSVQDTGEDDVRSETEFADTTCTNAYPRHAADTQTPPLTTDEPECRNVVKSASLVVRNIDSSHRANSIISSISVASRHENKQPPPKLDPDDDVLGEMIQDLRIQDASRAARKVRDDEKAAAVLRQQAGLNNRANSIPFQSQLAVLEASQNSDGAEAEKAQFNAREARHERDVTPSHASSKILIDTNSEPQEPRATSYYSDLEGMTYEHPSTKEVVVTARISETSASCVKIESPDIIVKPDPDIPSGSAFAPIKTEDLDNQQVNDADDKENGALSAAKLSRNPTGIDLSKDSLAILSDLNINHYRQLCRAFDEAQYWIKQIGWSGPGTVQEHAAVQVIVTHLARHTRFKGLSSLERLKTATVVYSNLQQLKTRNLIRYSLDSILQLRRHARPAPPAVILANDYMKLATKTSRQNRFDPTASAAALPESRTSAQRTPDNLDAAFQVGPTRSSLVDCSDDEEPVPNAPEPTKEISPRGTETTLDSVHDETPQEVTNLQNIQNEQASASEVLEAMEATVSHATPNDGPQDASRFIAAQSQQAATITSSQGSRGLPPHLRGVGDKNGLGNSRWA